MRFLLIILFFCNCSLKEPNLKPEDTKFSEEEKNCEQIYALELAAALKNQDDLAFYFFWPYYMWERYKNKCKKYNPSHYDSCICQQKTPFESDSRN